MGGAVSGLVGGAMNLVGGLVGGSKAADAAKGQAEALRAAGDRASAMAAFTPYGTTTAFGTSKFEDGKGSYTLSPQLQAIQGRLFQQAGSYDPTQLAQAAQPLYGAAGSLFNIGSQLLPTDMSRQASPEAQALAQQYYAAQQGLMPTSYQTGNTAEAQAAQQQYQEFARALSPTSYATNATPEAMAAAEQYRQISAGLLPTSYQTGASPEAQAYANQLRQTGQGYLAQSPEEARAEYMRTQQAVLAPGQEQQLAELRNQTFQTGRSGLAVGGTQAGGLQATNPEMAAYYNSLANTNRQLAAGAEQAAQQRQTLGLGMLGQGLSAQQQSEATNRANMLQNIGVGTGLTNQALTTQQQSEATQRANLLQNMGLSAGYTGQALSTQQQDAATQRQQMLQNLGLSLGFGTQGLATGTTAEEQARARYAEDLRMGAGLFGTGGALLGQVPALTTAGYSPLQTQLGLLGTTEAMGQQPYNQSIDLANQYAQAGARQGQLYLSPQQAAAQAYSQYQGYSPMSAALSGAGSALSGMGGGASSWFSNLLGSTNKSVDINTMPTSNWASGNF